MAGHSLLMFSLVRSSAPAFMIPTAASSPILPETRDERDIVTKVPQQPQGVGRPEAWHVIVGDHDLEKLVSGVRRT